MQWLSKCSLLMVSLTATAVFKTDAPEFFEIAGLPAWLERRIGRIETEAKANPELAIAMEGLTYAKETLYAHMGNIIVFSSFESFNKFEDDSKNDIIQAVASVYVTLEKATRALARQLEFAEINIVILGQLGRMYKQLVDAAKFCELLARHSDGQVFGGLYREMHAIIYRSLGVRTYLKKLSPPIFTRKTFDKIFRALDAPRLLNLDLQAQSVVNAYRALDNLDHPQLSLTLGDYAIPAAP